MIIMADSWIQYIIKPHDKWNHIFDAKFRNEWFDADTFHDNVLDNLCMLNLDFRKKKVSEKFILIVIMFKKRKYEINLVKIIGDFLSELYSLK